METEFKVWMGTMIDKFLEMSRWQNETMLELKGMMREFIDSAKARQESSPSPSNSTSSSYPELTSVDASRTPLLRGPSADGCRY